MLHSYLISNVYQFAQIRNCLLSDSYRKINILYSGEDKQVACNILATRKYVHCVNHVFHTAFKLSKLKLSKLKYTDKGNKRS